MIETKKCNGQCGETKQLSEFYTRVVHSKTKGSYIYHYPECKECTKNRSYQWQLDNPQRKKEIRKKYVGKPETILVNREQQRRSLKKGVRREWQQKNKEKLKVYRQEREPKKHDISEIEWWECRRYFNFRCAYCGKTWEDQYREHSKDFCRDHFLNNGPNDITNCIPACVNCNSSKNSFAFEEWLNRNIIDSTKERIHKIKKWIAFDAYNYKDI